MAITTNSSIKVKPTGRNGAVPEARQHGPYRRRSRSRHEFALMLHATLGPGRSLMAVPTAPAGTSFSPTKPTHV